MKRTVSELLQPPPCAGCSDHVLIKLRSLELVQGADASCTTPVEGQSLADGYHNVLADRPDATSHVFAQGTITAVEDQAYAGFALWHGGANPVHGALEIGFALPKEAAAKLELLDVSGRVVTSRDLGSLGPGSHRTRLELTRGMGAGIYWVKLSQAGETRTLKCVLMP